LIGETFVSVGADGPGLIEPRLILPVAVDLVEVIAPADESPLMTTPFMEGWARAPWCARASAVRSLRRAATPIPLRISRTNRVSWAPVGLVWRIDSNRLVTSLPALVSAGFWAISAACALPPAAESSTRSSRHEANSGRDGMQRR
jgi:hypothetical protein